MAAAAVKTRRKAYRPCRVLVLLDGATVAHLIRAEGPFLAVCGIALRSGRTYHECWGGPRPRPRVCSRCERGKALALHCSNSKRGRL